MRRIVEWSVNSPVLANLLMVFLLGFGTFTAINVKRETFPEFSLDRIQVSVEYRGASAEEIEESICVKIEEELAGIEGIKKLTSNAEDNLGVVIAELEDWADPGKVQDDIKNAVDQIDTFPKDADKPITVELTMKKPVIQASVYGDVSELILTKTAEKVRDDLMEMPGISQVSLVGKRDYEILVEISENTLRKYGLTLEQVANLIRTNSFDLPGGSLETESGEIRVRTKGQLYTADEFKELVILSPLGGTEISLGQIATVRDTFENMDIRPRMNGKPAIVVKVEKTSDEDALYIADRVKQYVEKANTTLPDTIRLAFWSDDSALIRSRLNLLTRNFFQGLVLVFLIVSLFMRFRLAFWVAMGIPVSVLGAFVFLGWYGFTLNMISMFSFIVVLGVVVDDAIVIGENVYTKMTEGRPLKEAAINGASELAYPVINSVATTIVAFAPMLYVAGTMGKLLEVFPVAIIAVLLVSLFEVFVIMPAHLAHMKPKEDTTSRWSIFAIADRIQTRVDTRLQSFIDNWFVPAMRLTVHQPYVCSAAIVALLIICAGLVAGGRIGFVLFPKMESDTLLVKLVFPQGTPIETTEAAVQKLEDAVQETARRNPRKDGKSVVTRIFSISGEMVTEADRGSHAAEIIVELMPSEERGVPSSEMVKVWRKLAGDIPDALAVTYSSEGITPKPGGLPIEIQLLGNDLDELRSAAQMLKQKLAAFTGVEDVQDSYRPAKPEIRLALKPGTRQLGLTLADLARQTKANLWGEEPIKIQRGRDEVTVRVRYPEYGKAAVGDLETMRVRTADNREIPFSSVASMAMHQGPAKVQRIYRKRAITVTADVDEDKANASEIVRNLSEGFFDELHRAYPGVRVLLEGQKKETDDSVGSILKGFVVAVLIIYVLLVGQFRTYTHPLIVMAAIPFSFIGVVIGHILFGIDITLFSICGVVALAGIVVNDSLLLIDASNSELAQGKPLEESLVIAGRKRFRQILLTSISTMAGLTPILLETSFQAQFLKPMTVSVVFGVMVATVLILLFIPSLVVIRNDILKALGRRYA